MSHLLVFLQLTLIGLIAYPSVWPSLNPFNLALCGLGLAVGFVAFFTMPRKTFAVMPEPAACGELVTHGIYRFIRHPMYLGILLCAIGADLAYQTPWKWGAAMALCIVLVMKMRREERLLLARFPAYEAYKKRTKAIVPFLI